MWEAPEVYSAMTSFTGCARTSFTLLFSPLPGLGEKATTGGGLLQAIDLCCRLQETCNSVRL